MIDRTLPFEGIFNFRDYGGYAVAGGGRLRNGRLYRSAQLRSATDNDRRALGAIKLGAVVDLRGPGERNREPSRLPDDFTGRVLITDIETGAMAPHIEAAVKGVSNIAEALAASQAVFADMPFRPVNILGLRNYFTALAETDGPTLVHCSAGKDRTGIAVALLHTMLGVHPDDIIGDFLLTNASRRAEERLAANIAAVRQAFGVHLSDEAAHVLAGVDPSFLATALGAINERHGNAESYLRDVVGIDRGTIDQAKQRLVA